MLVQLYWQVEGNMCCLFGAIMSWVNTSLRQHAADAENLKRKLKASHFLDSGEQRLSPITGILKQAFSCFHAESYWSLMSSVHVLLRDLGCLKLQEFGACLGEVPGASRHSCPRWRWKLQMWIWSYLDAPHSRDSRCIQYKRGIRKLYFPWMFEQLGQQREAESKYVTAIPDDDALLEMNQHERVRVSFGTLVLCSTERPSEQCQ